MRRAIITLSLLLALMLAGCATTERGETMDNPNLADRDNSDDRYIFTLREDVERESVYYRNRFGIELAGDIYTAKYLDESILHPAIVIGPPFGGVKEQGPGVYANELAARGFVVLTFDPSYHGYSGGEPRMTGSTALYAEDFSAGIDFLGTLPYVDREKIALIGICGSGGFALSAASMDPRAKAVVTSVMYDIAGMGSFSQGEARRETLRMMVSSRWDDFENGTGTFIEQYAGAPYDKIPEGLDPVSAEFHEFYATERGYHPNANGNLTNASMADIMTFPGLEHISDIGVPILFVAGDIAHSRAFSEEAYAKASEPKELYLVEGARHIDLYDDVEKIPFDKIEEFLSSAFSE